MARGAGLISASKPSLPNPHQVGVSICSRVVSQDVPNRLREPSRYLRSKLIKLPTALGATVWFVLVGFCRVGCSWCGRGVGFCAPAALGATVWFVLVGFCRVGCSWCGRGVGFCAPAALGATVWFVLVGFCRVGCSWCGRVGGFCAPDCTWCDSFVCLSLDASREVQVVTLTNWLRFLIDGRVGVWGARGDAFVV